MSKIKIFGLGGLNDIGKNMYVVEIDSNIFVFDAGLKYADDRMLGVDYIIPEYEYLKENIKRVKGIFITHGHEQQMGALVDILEDIKDIKVYGTEFTLEIIKDDFIKENLSTDNLITIQPHKKINFGEISVFPISLTHSVPENVGYVINTKDGAIVYTGNFMFDPSLLGYYQTDIGKLAYIGKQGVLCLMSESLYADKLGFTSPKHRTASILSETINRNEGRILVNVFATQLFRLQELFTEIMKGKRNVVIMGKSLLKIITNSIEKGYIKFDKERILGVNHVNDEGIIILISDEREKPYSNMKRIIKGFDKFIKISNKDTVLFASPVYDGMEKTSTEVFDKIAKMGANLVIISSKKYYSLHASSEDIMLMLNLMKPKYYFPVIGEYRHLVANKEIALKLGMDEKDILLRLNGEVINITDGQLIETNEKVAADDILIDGKTVGDIGELVLKDREQLSENGILITIVTLNKKTKKIVSGPEILTRGFIFVKDNADLIKEIEKLALEIIIENTNNNYIDFNKVRFSLRDKIGKYLYQETECKPMILSVIQEVE
ncbi:MAG: ribonuclease J [Bacilli bacterium]|nr:ribonuclease J [Bacilli bacterium]MDD4733517.1 ribonuclease J [Bacilli bacterium]